MTAGLLALLADLRRPRGWTLAAYAASAALAVGILPTNVLPFGVLALWALSLSACSRAWRSRRALGRLAALCLAPGLGFLWYALVLDRLGAHALGTVTPFTVGGVLAEWHTATLAGLGWAWPVLPFGLIALLLDARREASWAPESPRGRLLFVLVCACAPPLFLTLMRQVPFARTLVPLLPLWYGAVAILLAAACGAAARAAPVPAQAAGALFMAVLSLTACLRETRGDGYGERHPAGTKPHGLYDQYYHHDFRPSLAAREIRRLASGRPTVVLTDDADLWALQAYGADRAGARLLYEGALTLREEDAAELARFQVLLLTYGDAAARAMAARLLLPTPESLRLVSDTGFFKIYDWPGGDVISPQEGRGREK